MRECRVCGRSIGAPVFEAPAPALTSILTPLDVPTRVYICDYCGHAQNDDIPDIQRFYDSVYRISLESEGHDQIFAVMPDGGVIYRTDHQAAIALRLLDLPRDAAILDYGAAKATTLRKMCKARPDLRPHVFDVSADYAASWREWLGDGAMATYAVPPTWRGGLDAAMSHFAIEHVADPIHFIREIGALLRPAGKLLISMPDVAENPGDMTVSDHLSHFSEPSLRHALARGGFQVVSIDRQSFPGAFFAVAVKTQAKEPERDAAYVARAVTRALEICAFWKRATARLDQQVSRLGGRKAAIYGAGFYGSWIHGRIAAKMNVLAFLDRNPHLRGRRHLRYGRPAIRSDADRDGGAFYRAQPAQGPCGHCGAGLAGQARSGDGLARLTARIMVGS